MRLSCTTLSVPSSCKSSMDVQEVPEVPQRVPCPGDTPASLEFVRVLDRGCRLRPSGRHSAKGARGRRAVGLNRQRELHRMLARRGRAGVLWGGAALAQVTPVARYAATGWVTVPRPSAPAPSCRHTQRSAVAFPPRPASLQAGARHLHVAAPARFPDQVRSRLLQHASCLVHACSSCCAHLFCRKCVRTRRPSGGHPRRICAQAVQVMETATMDSRRRLTAGPLAATLKLYPAWQRTPRVRALSPSP